MSLTSFSRLLKSTSFDSFKPLACSVSRVRSLRKRATEIENYIIANKTLIIRYMVASENFQAVDTPTVQVCSFLQVISSILNCAVELWLPVLSEFNSAYASTQMSRKIA